MGVSSVTDPAHAVEESKRHLADLEFKLIVKFVELRRHSVRDRSQEGLSVDGRALAADVGHGRGPFGVVVSSTAQRAVDTAEAMGFPPQVRSPLWFGFVSAEIPWPLTFEGYGGQFRSNPVARSLALELEKDVRDLLARLEEGQQALVVSHGGMVELTAAIWCSRDELAELGPPCKCMEGVMLRFERDAFVGAETLRVPEARTRL